MSVIEQIQAISLVLTMGFGWVVVQSLGLSRVLRSWSWYAIAGGLFVIGGLQVWSFVKLPTALMKAQMAGQLPDSLTLEQDLRIALIVSAITLLIVGFAKLRKDLHNIGR